MYKITTHGKFVWKDVIVVEYIRNKYKLQSSKHKSGFLSTPRIFYFRFIKNARRDITENTEVNSVANVFSKLVCQRTVQMIEVEYNRNVRFLVNQK